MYLSYDHIKTSNYVFVRVGVEVADLLHRHGSLVIGWDTEFAIDWSRPDSR